MERHIIGHLNWNTRVRFLAGLGVAVVLFGSLGYAMLKPWDPQGAISLQLVENGPAFLIRVTGLLLAVGVFAALLIDARLALFGTFAACIGMGIPIVKTATMQYLMICPQAGKNPQGLWGYLALETLAWSAVLAALVVASLFTEQWLRRDPEASAEGLPARGRTDKTKDRSAAFWFRGLGGLVITVVLGVFLVTVFAASLQKGQVVFAVAFGFFLAALTAEQIAENDHPVWQVAAVPIVALIAYIYTGLHPDRPAGLEDILTIAPNALARLLPVEYIFVGAIGAIFGNWTSHRMRYHKAHE